MKVLLHISIILFALTSLNGQKNTDANSKLSIADALMSSAKSSIDETIEYYFELKAKDLERYNFEDEYELNKLGYEYLYQGKKKDAIEIFKLLVSEFPAASNAYDSLAEAYYHDEKLDLAVVNYEKSLALNPNNINAEDWINRIKYAEYDNTRFDYVYSVEQYQEDLDELAKRLTEVNPNAFKFISELDFWSGVASKKELLNAETTFSEFIWHCSEIIANIDCGHTSMGYFNQEDKMLPVNLRFPLEIGLLGNTLYVTDPLINQNLVSPSSEILTINGFSVSEIQTEIYKHISSQGSIESYKRQFFNANYSSLIPYALGFPKSYEVLFKGDSEPKRLLMLKEYKRPARKQLSACEKTLCLDIQEGKIALITLKSFAYYANSFSEYKSFIDSSFQALSEHEIEHLIIDVRGNGGGPSDAGTYLLKYLAQSSFKYFSESQYNEKLEFIEPFKHKFTGKSYFLIDGNGGSTTGHFMSLIKDLKISTIIGEELGSNQFCTGGQKRLRLPNTGIQYSVARNSYLTSATSFPLDRGIMPEHFVSQSINEYINNIDAVMNYTMQLIQEEKKW